jgi:signal transduction histidine kinase
VQLEIERQIIWGDERRLKQVLVNLLSNAVKFTDRGGIVTIDAGRNEDGSMNISVSDTGIGMSDDELKMAMEKFG